MLATVGAYKHAILHEFVSLELRERHFAPHEAAARDPQTWMGRVRPQLTHAAGRIAGSTPANKPEEWSVIPCALHPHIRTAARTYLRHNRYLTCLHRARNFP